MDNQDIAAQQLNDNQGQVGHNQENGHQLAVLPNGEIKKDFAKLYREWTHKNTNEKILVIKEWYKKNPKENLAFILLAVSSVVIILHIFPLMLLVALGVFFASASILLKKQFILISQRGLLTKMTDKLQFLLLEKSLYDILADLWYFPIVPKYAKAILGPFITKAPPEQTMKNFDDLNPKFKQIMLTKGIINLFPQKVENFILPKQIQLQKNFNNCDPQTLLKNTYYRQQDYLAIKQAQEKQMTLKNNKIGFLRKFCRGSMDITTQERKTIFYTFLFSTLMFLLQLYFSKKARFSMKNLIKKISFIVSMLFSLGSFLLIMKRRKALKK